MIFILSLLLFLVPCSSAAAATFESVFYKDKNIAPLHRAAASGDPKLVAFLLKYDNSEDNDVNIRTKNRLTPLHVAAAFGHQEVAELLLDHGAKTDDPIYCHDVTLLGIAAQYGQVPMIDYLVGRGARLISEDWIYDSPLCSAVAAGNMEGIKALLARGAMKVEREPQELIVDIYERRPWDAEDLEQRFGVYDRDSVMQLLVDAGVHEGISRCGSAISHYEMKNYYERKFKDLEELVTRFKCNPNVNASHMREPHRRMTYLDGVQNYKLRENPLEALSKLMALGFRASRAGRKQIIQDDYPEAGVDQEFVHIAWQLQRLKQYGEAADISDYAFGLYLDWLTPLEKYLADYWLYQIKKFELVSQTPDALYAAVKIKEGALVKHLMSCGLSMNDRSVCGESPIHLAAELGSYEILNLARTSGADTQAADVFGRTPMHHAAKNKDAAWVLKLLRDCGIDANRMDAFVDTALNVAAHFDNLAAVQFLVEECGALDIVDNTIKETDRGARGALHIAAGLGHLSVVHYLAEKGWDVNKKEHGDDYCGDLRNEGPLGQAGMGGHVEVMRCLLEHGAKAEPKQIFNWLTYNIGHNKSPEKRDAMVRFVVEELGIDLRSLHGEPFTKKQRMSVGLFDAIEKNRSDIVNYLLEHGADPNDMGVFDETAVCLAAAKHDIALVERLIGLGGDPNLPDVFGRSALAYYLMSNKYMDMEEEKVKVVATEEDVERLVDLGCRLSEKEFAALKPEHQDLVARVMFSEVPHDEIIELLKARDEKIKRMTKFAQDLTEAREICSAYGADVDPATVDELFGNYRALEQAIRNTKIAENETHRRNWMAIEKLVEALDDGGNESSEEEYELLDDES